MTAPRAGADQLDLGQSDSQVPFTKAQRAELERRIADLEHDPDQGISWEEARRRILGRSP